MAMNLSEEIQVLANALLASETDFDANSYLEPTPPPPMDTTDTTSTHNSQHSTTTPALNSEQVHPSIPHSPPITCSPNTPTPKLTTPQAPITPTTTPSPTTGHTITTFDKLVKLHKIKNNHLHHINILHKHIHNHSTPKGLTINLQPRFELSPEHKASWDSSIRDCMSQLTNILHNHHQKELTKVQSQISSITNTLQAEHSPAVSTTIIDLATNHQQKPRKRKAHITPSRTPNTNSPIKPTTTPPSKRHKPQNQHHNNHQGFHKRPHRPNNPAPPLYHMHTPPLQIPPTHHATTKLRKNNMMPLQSPINTTTIRQQLVGKQSQFPTLYKMFMRGKP